ncbi:MAG: cation transporter [Oscillospiraceae bacterium]|jgi:copper chaperone CopZ|nr:cation transporter [Oscillospiraceae bacterium]
MKKSYKLDGLCCANCAAKIEREISALKGVIDANVNFMTTKLVFETALDADVDEIVTKAQKIVLKHEPGVVFK